LGHYDQNKDTIREEKAERKFQAEIKRNRHDSMIDLSN